MSCFNPHPSRGTGATFDFEDVCDGIRYVSILTRPEGRVQRFSARRMFRILLVSILTRPEGRVQQPTSSARASYSDRVSILTRPEGRVQLLYGMICMYTFVVSILTRPEGRVQLTKKED